MQYFIGLDGGGTKTACLLVDENGQTLATATGHGSSYRQHGLDTVVQLQQQLVAECRTAAGLTDAPPAGMCLGLPLVGEDAKMDKLLALAVQNAFGKTALLCNDVVVGWAGALALQPGVNIVAGTGSIAYGRHGGKEARSGGWSEYFSDEGSSYWLALRGMQLFTKQADGRAKRGELYSMVRREFLLDNDFEFVPIMEKLLQKRDKTAAFQKLLCDAGDAGDETVAPLYEEAARELCAMAAAVCTKLAIAAPAPVSYSGGTFRAGDVLLKPLQAMLQKQGMRLVQPLLTPVEGAALLAAESCGHEAAVRQGLLQSQKS